MAIKDSLDGLAEPVLHWLEARARYVGGANCLDWVARDPVVACLAPALVILDRQGLLHLSEDARQAAEQQYLVNKARWMVREDRLKQVLGVLHQAGIAIIPLKGAILQGQLYHDSGLRALGDIDILVRADQYLRAAELLLGAGLQLYPGSQLKSLATLTGVLASSLPAEIEFIDRNNTLLALDLHRHLLYTPWLMPGYTIDIDLLWRRAMPLAAGDDGSGLWKLTLSPYDTLAHLILHQAVHGLLAMQTYLDIGLWLKNLPASWDWDQFIELVNHWQIRSATYHTLMSCREFMDVPLPEDILKRLDPGWLARGRVRLLVSPASLLAHRPSLGRRYPTLVRLALIDRLPRLFWILVKLAFPDKAWRQQHPEQRSFFAHWLYVLRVFKRWG